MKKFDNKGFALVETLIVSVFVVSLFLIVFNNFYPLMSEYEKREVYDDVDGVYAAYWIKRLVENSSYSLSELSSYVYGIEKDGKTKSGWSVAADTCKTFLPNDGEKKAICDKIVTAYEIALDRVAGKFYIVNYNISDFKHDLREKTYELTGKLYVDPELEDYLSSLPDYSNPRNNTYNANFRVIVSMKRGYKDIEGNYHEYMAYSNMEGNK